MATFNEAFEGTSAHEGGYVNDPVDRGGETAHQPALGEQEDDRDGEA